MAKRRKTITDPERLQELIEEATVDAYGEDEQHSGFVTMIQDNVVCPFKAKVIGENVEVTGLDWPDSGYGVKVMCRHKGKTYPIDIASLEWTDALPEGFEWIEAYFEWLKGL